MKIIYLVQSKFCKRDYDRFGIELLSKRGYNDIEVWDLSAWFRPEYFIEFTPKDLISGDNYKSISNKEVVMELLESLSGNNVFICVFRPNVKSTVIFDYLNKNQYIYGFISFGHYPCHSMFSRVKQILNRPIFVLEQLANSIIVKIYTLIAPPIEANFAILGGGVATSKYIGDKTTLLKTHTLDYDLFLDFKDAPRVTQKKKYIVFLDDYAPYHPDSTGRNTMNPKLYYSILNNFFGKIESKMGMDVVIAPHPRSDYKSIGNPFYGRTISSRPTIQTVRDSDLVISHGSTATSFAVLYGKPMLFMGNRLSDLYLKEIAKNTAGFFHKKPIDTSVSNLVIQKDDLAVDSSVYNSYKELYIKESDTPEKKTWDIFADYLDTLKTT